MSIYRCMVSDRLKCSKFQRSKPSASKRFYQYIVPSPATPPNSNGYLRHLAVDRGKDTKKFAHSAYFYEKSSKKVAVNMKMHQTIPFLMRIQIRIN